MELKRVYIPLEIKVDGDVNDNSGTFEGYGSVFDNVDLGADIVRPGAFTKTLDKWSSKGQLPQMLFDHRPGEIIGDWLEMSEDSRGLKVKGLLWVRGERKIDRSMMVYNVLKGTGPKGLSIGFYVKDSRETETFEGVVREILEVDLVEVSVAPYAMNPEAMVTGVKKVGESPTIREVENILREGGISTKKAKAILAGGFNAAYRDDKSKGDVDSRDAGLDEELLEGLKNITSLLQQ